jgi:phage-related protein
MGYQLDELQQGNTPDDFEPMKTIGPGVYELRVRAEGQAWRVFYVARFEEAIYVLHGFEKKSQKTPQKNIATGRARYAELLRSRS